jgi:hypothetical protein
MTLDEESATDGSGYTPALLDGHLLSGKAPKTTKMAFRKGGDNAETA